jgi:outer membrane protein OmpA-like peptidoglycan-associated protein
VADVQQHPDPALSRRRRLIVACSMTCAAGFAPALAMAAGAVGTVQINQAVRPIDVVDAVRPIDLKDAVVPLEVQSTHGATSVITVSSDVLFGFNQAALTSQALRTIANLARRIPQRPGITIRVDGYTDSLGTAAYNDTLSRRRAAAVAAALERDLGSAATKVVATGHGEADPVAPNQLNGKDNPAGRAKNRRVTVGFPH